MPNNRDFSYLELVHYHDDIYAVLNCCRRRGMIDVAPAPPSQNVNDGSYEQGDYFLWFPLHQVEKLRPVPADAATIRSFFRLDKSVWELAHAGKFPFAPDSANLVPTTEDMKVALTRLPYIDFVSLEHWYRLFSSAERIINPQDMDDKAHLLYALLSCRISESGWEYFDTQDQQESLQPLLDNADRPLSDWVIDATSARLLLVTIEEMAQEDPISDDLRHLYIRVLEDETGTDEAWRSQYRAYAYYGGNSVVACDWRKSEQALLKAYALTPDPRERMWYANSLGYIYYSKRLGVPDYAKAFRYFSEAAESGATEALYKVSDMHRKGHGTPVDGQKALDLLQPLYELELKRQQNGHYNNKLADVALRMGYCARDGVGREVSLREAYRYFRQAKNAIATRLAKCGSFGDTYVQTNIERVIEELLQSYSPSSESYVGMVGQVQDQCSLARCLQDDGTTLLIRTIDASHTEQRVPRESFTPLDENIRDVGDQVILRQGNQPAVIRTVNWHRVRGTAVYTLAIGGKNSTKWYVESNFAPVQVSPTEMSDPD